MKRSDIQAIVDYMYKDELRDFAASMPEDTPIDTLVNKAREIKTGHIFCHVQALADFLDE